MKKVFLLFLFCVSINNAATTLNPGDIVIVAINGDDDATYGKGFSFMPLVNLEAGTIIHFTDYGWSDANGAFITNTSISDNFIYYTTPAGGITAGTVIRCSSKNSTNFTFESTYSGVGNNSYLSLGGLTQSDEVLVFQGSIASPTFIFAATYVSTAISAAGWATSVGANGTDGSGAGSALPPGLTNDVTALSFNQVSTANDNCAYTGVTTATTMAGWRDRVKTYSDWTFNDAIPIPTPPTGPFTVTDALPVELISFTASIEQNIVALNWQTATEVNNYGFNVERCKVQGSVEKVWEKLGFVNGHGNSNSPKSYSFTDSNPSSGTVQYRLKQIDFDGKYEYSDVVDVEVAAPAQFKLAQNFPNPFNPETRIKFFIPLVETSHGASLQNVALKVFDMLGREVATLVNEQKAPGNYEVKFDGSMLASGVYFYKLQSGSFTQTKKFILMK